MDQDMLGTRGNFRYFMVVHIANDLFLLCKVLMCNLFYSNRFIVYVDSLCFRLYLRSGHCFGFCTLYCLNYPNADASEVLSDIFIVDFVDNVNIYVVVKTYFYSSFCFVTFEH